MVSVYPSCAYIGSATMLHSWIGPNVYRAVLITGLNGPDIARHELEFSDEVVEGGRIPYPWAPSIMLPTQLESRLQSERR